MMRKVSLALTTLFLLGGLYLCPSASAMSIYTNLRPDHAAELETFLAEAFPDVSVEVDYRSPSADEIVSGKHDLTFLTLDVSYLVDQGALVPLDTYLARDGLSEADVKGALSSIATNGRVYHLPALVDPWVVMYNRALFDRKSISYPTNQWTWADFAEKSNALTEDIGTLARVWGATSGYNGTAGLLLDISHQTGRSLLDVDEASLESFFELWADIVIEDRSMYDNRLGRGHSLVQHFRSSTAAMQITTLLTAFNWADQDRIASSIRWDVAPLPSFPDTVSHTPLSRVYGVGVGSGSERPLEAWNLAKFVTGHEAARFFISLGYVPAALNEALISEWIGTVAKKFDISPEGLSEALDRPLFMSDRNEYPFLVELRNLTPQLESGALSRHDAFNAIRELRQRLLHGE